MTTFDATDRNFILYGFNGPKNLRTATWTGTVFTCPTELLPVFAVSETHGMAADEWFTHTLNMHCGMPAYGYMV